MPDSVGIPFLPALRAVAFGQGGAGCQFLNQRPITVMGLFHECHLLDYRKFRGTYFPTRYPMANAWDLCGSAGQAVEPTTKLTEPTGQTC